MVQEMKARKLSLPPAVTLSKMFQAPSDLSNEMLKGFFLAMYWYYKNQPEKPDNWNEIQTLIQSESALKIQKAYRTFKRRKDKLQRELVETCKQQYWEQLKALFRYDPFSDTIKDIKISDQAYDNLIDDLIKIQAVCPTIEGCQGALCVTDILDADTREFKDEALVAFVKEMSMREDGEAPAKPSKRSSQPRRKIDCSIDTNQLESFMTRMNRIDNASELNDYYQTFLETFRQRCTDAADPAFANLEFLFQTRLAEVERQANAIAALLQFKTSEAPNDWD